MKHLLGIEDLSKEELEQLIDDALKLKAERSLEGPKPLEGETWAMIFTKSSTRTRVSFETGLNELGARPMFLNANDVQLGRGEPIKDTARVLGRMVHGAIIRTFDHQDVIDFSNYGKIPTINALTDEEHPCQILADLLTMKELVGGWEDKKVVFAGDGDCNMGRSWAWAAKHLGFKLVIAAPHEFQPDAAFMKRLGKAPVVLTEDIELAAEHADVLYTDTWVSMGKEAEAEARLKALAPFQIHSRLVKKANPGVIVQHCLPAYRGKEITEELLEGHADEIFQQAENRLHAQKAVLIALREEHPQG